jgi:hypothetical protein
VPELAHLDLSGPDIKKYLFLLSPVTITFEVLPLFVVIRGVSVLLQ